MAIVATEIVSNTMVGVTRYVVYRCQDSYGEWHQWGPVFAPESFDADAHKATIAERVQAYLEQAEIDAELGNG